MDQELRPPGPKWVDKNDMRVYNENRHECRKRRKMMAGKRERTRDHILNASYRLFAEKGFKQVTMKDVCEITKMSRGGLYSHFSGTEQLFEALLEKVSRSDGMDFQSQIDEGITAVTILKNALNTMEDEIMHPEDSLSAAIYEYADAKGSDVTDRLNREAVKRWKALIRYGTDRGEFIEVNEDEIVNVILFSYQGARMWSRIISMKPDTFHSIADHIMKQLTGGLR